MVVGSSEPPSAAAVVVFRPAEVVEPATRRTIYR
jgi:hypothetical protein